MNTPNPTITVTRRQALVCGGILAGFLLLTLCSFAFYFHAQLDRLREAQNGPLSAPVSVTGASSVYTLREYEGKIGVFEAGEKTPMQVLDVYVFTLPEPDRTALQSGIRVYSPDALRSLIEDFTG